jgi:hypothetical protein
MLGTNEADEELIIMRLNAKRTATGIAVAGLTVAGLASGGVALASARPGAAPATPSRPVAAQPYRGNCPGGDGRSWMLGWRAGQQPVLRAAAAYLGMSEGALRAQLQAGRSLADVTRAHGKQVAGLQDALLAAMTRQIDASSGLSAGQKAAMLHAMRAYLGEMVNAAGYGSGEMGRMGAPGGMGMWN